MLRLKQAGLVLFGGCLLAVAAMLIWAAVPPTVDQKSADAAVVYANTVTDGNNIYREAYFTYRSRTLHYVEAGYDVEAGREVILFIHGFPSYWFSFFPQMQALKGAYHVVAIDGLGAGHSDAPGPLGAYKLEAMAEHLIALIDHLGADKVHLVGHDWGSVFALGFAQRHPGRVHTVTGLSAPPQNIMLGLLESDAAHRELFAYVEQLKKANPVLLLLMGIERRVWDGAYGPLVGSGKLSPEEGALFLNTTGDPKRIDRHINWYRANIPAPDEIETADYWPAKTARIAAPALFIWGTGDRIITTRAVAELQALSDDLKLLPIPGVGHWPHLEQPDRVTAAIRSVLGMVE